MQANLQRALSCLKTARAELYAHGVTDDATTLRVNVLSTVIHELQRQLAVMSGNVKRKEPDRESR